MANLVKLNNQLEKISLKIDYKNINDDIGKNGFVKFIINLDYKSINNTNYKTGCDPWKVDKLFFIFWVKENENKFNFSGYEISLFYYNKFEIIKLDKEILDLISQRKVINVADNEDLYELKFDILLYNKEIIYWKNYFIGYKPLNCLKKAKN